MKRPPFRQAFLPAFTESVCLTLLVALPAFFNLSVERIFEEEKALLLRAGAMLVAFMMVGGTARHARMWRHPIMLSLAAFSLVLALSSATGVAPHDSWVGSYYRRHGVATWAALVAVCAGLVTAARSAGSAERIWQATILGSVWPSVYAVCQTFGIDPVQWTDTVPGRAASTAGNALLFGGYLAVVLPLTACVCLRPGMPQVKRAFYAAILLLQAGALMATGSRGPMVAAFAGTIAGLLVLLGARRPRLAAAAIVLLVAGAAASTTTSFVAQSFASGSGRVRVLIWQGLLESLRNTTGRLWLGSGPETIRLVSPRYYTPEIAAIEGTEAMPDRAHNEVLDTLVSAGAIGVVAQMTMFAAVIWCALRLSDPFLRAALVSGAFAHIVEIQLGIATVMSRLAFLSIAAVVVVVDTRPGEGQPAPESPSRFVIFALGAAAITMFASFSTIEDPARYVLLLACASGLAFLVVPGPHRARDYLVTGVAVVAAAIAALPIALTPSRADRFSRTGRALEQARNWGAAVDAYRAAADLRPREPYYLTALGHALLEYGSQRPSAEHGRWYDEAHATVERARVLDPYDPNQPRNLASVARRRAAESDVAEERGRLLARADQYYEQATRLAPGMEPLWIEWANVALEQRDLEAAAARLDRAEALNASDVDAWILRGLVRLGQQRLAEAIDAYDHALALRADSVAALRGRAVTLAQLGRTADALKTVDQLLGIDPADNMGQRLRAALLNSDVGTSDTLPQPRSAN